MPLEHDDWDGRIYDGKTNLMIFFTHFDHNYQLNLDETSFLYNGSKLKVIGIKEKPLHDTNEANKSF